MRMPGRGYQFEGIVQFAPYLFGILFLVVIIALIRNWVDELSGPDRAQQSIDIRRVHRQGARGLIQ